MKKKKIFNTKNKKFKATFSLKGPWFLIGMAAEDIRTGDLLMLNPDHGWVVKYKEKGEKK